MKNKSLLLLKNLLLSASQSNVYRHTTDKKKKNRIILNTVGLLFGYSLLMAYCVLMCVGYANAGAIDTVPVLCPLTISALAAVFTFLKTNGYLFGFREYDMLISLPFNVRTVAACKFLYMYVSSLPWYMSISAAMLIGYGCYAAPAMHVYPLWIILSFFVPLIPMVIATLLGFIIAWIGSHFKKSNLVQIILTCAFILFIFYSRFILESVFRNDKVIETLEQAKMVIDDTASVYPPAAWFADAVTKASVSGVLLLTGISILLFSIVFIVVGISYRKINSALSSHAVTKDYKIAAMKKRSVENAIAHKEFRRLTGSTAYFSNAAIGQILVTVFALATLFVGFDRIIAMITSNAPVDPAIVRPAIPFIIYFFLGMVSTCACSPSLEGKNYWIVQSLPIEKKTLYRGKMLFNMYITVPFMIFSTLCLCISAHVAWSETLAYLILGFALCAFSTTWGCVCGIRHMRLDWENEIEVIKQGAAVSIYLLPNMFVTMGLTVGVVFLGMRMNHVLLAGIFILIASLLSVLCYRTVLLLAKKG